MDITLNSVQLDELDDRLRREDDLSALDRRIRITWVSRLELRLGLWLLLNSARRHGAALEHSRRVANTRALVEREHRALRAHALTGIRT